MAPAAGQSIDNVNFAVTARNGYGIHSVDTRAFPGSVAVKPPYLSPSMTYPFIVATGSGLINGNNPAPRIDGQRPGRRNLSDESVFSGPHVLYSDRLRRSDIVLLQ